MTGDPRRNNALHYAGLLLAIVNALQFVILNYRGILSWSGIGIYVTILYLVGFIVGTVIWVVAQIRSRSTFSVAFWLTMTLPIIFLALLPEKFFV